MYQINRIASVATYLARARTPKQVHSPYLYQVLPFIFDRKRRYYVFDQIEALREAVLSGDSNERKNTSLQKFVKKHRGSAYQYQCWFRLAVWCRAEAIIEIGSSTGISTAYLTSVSRTTRVVTLEEEPEAAQNIIDINNLTGCRNLQVLHGPLRQTLTGVSDVASHFDLAILNSSDPAFPECFEAILQHLEASSVVIIDGIRNSSSGWKAWLAGSRDPAVTAALDVFAFGILYFRNAFRNPVRLSVLPRRWPPRIICA